MAVFIKICLYLSARCRLGINERVPRRISANRPSGLDLTLVALFSASCSRQAETTKAYRRQRSMRRQAIHALRPKRDDVRQWRAVTSNIASGRSGHRSDRVSRSIARREPVPMTAVIARRRRGDIRGRLILSHRCDVTQLLGTAAGCGVQSAGQVSDQLESWALG